MDKFPKRFKIPKLTQEEIANMNSHVATKQMKTVQKNAPTKKIPGLEGFTGEFSQNISGKNNTKYTQNLLKN